MRSDETDKTARTTATHAMHSPRKVKPIVSSHKKGPLLKKSSRHLSDLTRKGLLLKQTKTPNKIVATDHKMRVDLWNLVTTCGVALRLEILIAGGSVLHQAWSSSAFFLKDIQTLFLLPWRLDPFCTVLDDTTQARSRSSEFGP